MGNSLNNPENCIFNIEISPKPEIERLYFDFNFLEEHVNSSHIGKGPIYDDSGSLGFQTDTTTKETRGAIRLDFDRLMSAFFDRVWFEKTHLESVVLMGEIVGNSSVTMLSQSANGDVAVTSRDYTSKSKPYFSIEVSKYKLLSPSYGRHWIVIESYDSFKVKSLGWYTDQEPVRNVTLGVVLATFNRPSFLGRTLESILLNDDSYEAAARIFVINQGDPFAIEDLVSDKVKDRAKEKITVIEQGNFGGAGGFTRGMMAVVDDDELTHVLLCDDDIVFEHSSLPRTKAFFSYAKQNMAMGGLMMDLMHPNVLYEAGAYIDRKRHVARPHKHQTDMSTTSAASAFLVDDQIDFNGWWFFGFDKKVLNDIGYPLPCFIRGDDVEFGKRLNRAGIETVVMPGVVVWHEPFYLKLGGWHYYFEVRNRLVYASLYRNDETADDLLKPLNKIFWRDLLTCRYYTAKLYLKAMSDFLSGEEAALSNDPKILKGVLSLKGEYGPKPLKKDETVPPFAPFIKDPTFAPLELLSYVKTFFSHLYKPHRVKDELLTVDAPNFNYWNTCDKTSFVVREPDQKNYLRFERNPRLFRELIFENMKLRKRFRKEYAKIAEQYRARSNQYTSRASWEEKFNKD